MSAIEKSNMSYIPAHDELPPKPFSLKVAEVAIPTLKVLGGLLALTAIAGLLFSYPVSLVAITATASAASLLFQWILQYRVDHLSSSKWVVYFSLAYYDKPLQELMRAIPNREVWKKLQWSRVSWAEKVCPYAAEKKMDRLALSQEFPQIFSKFDPYLAQYYSQVESHILQEKGFLELINRSVNQKPVSYFQDDLRIALLNEIHFLSCKQILDKYGALPFERGYLFPQDLVERFEQETQFFNLKELLERYPIDFLNRGILTTESLDRRLRIYYLSPTPVEQMEKEFPQLASRPDWSYLPTIIEARNLEAGI